jgi:hypothetical protein
MSNETMTLEARIAEAAVRGTKAGKAAASWVFDGNTTDETYRRTLQGIEDGDPEVMDRLSWSPLSGEWAGESIQELLGDLLTCSACGGDGIFAEAGYVEGAEEEPCNACDGTGYDTDAQEEIEEAYEEAAQDAYWQEIERVARFHTEG